MVVFRTRPYGRAHRARNADAIVVVEMSESLTTTRAPAGPTRLTPFCRKSWIEHLMMVTLVAETMWIPFVPVPSPSISRPLSVTSSPAGVLMMMPLVPETSTPASNPSELMVMGLVMVTPPNPPGSSTLISPLGAVFEIAPANVLHGAVRLQGLASSPTPDTQVRVACACAGVAYNTPTRTVARIAEFKTRLLM